MLTAPTWNPTAANWKIQRIAAEHIVSEPERYGKGMVRSAQIQLERIKALGHQSSFRLV